MPRKNWVDGMEITFADLSAAASAHEREIYDRVVYEMLQRKTDAFFGDGFTVSRVSATQVSVAAGSGYQYDNTQVTPEPVRRLLFNAAATALNIATPDVTNPRIDIVVCRANRANSVSASRKYKAATTGAISTQTLVTETDWAADLSIVTGTPAGSPAVPATPSGYLKLAEVTVSALTGIAASGAITDKRTKLPVGPDLLLDTTGYNKMTAGVDTKLSQLLADIDASLSAGGGGGGGMQWSNVSAGGDGAVQDAEFGQPVFLFPKDSAARVTVFMQVPASYVAGKAISMYLSFYTPDSSGNMKMKTTTTLIRQNQDALSSTTNQRASTNAQLTNTVANAPRRVLFDLTSTTGQVNSVSVAAGDILKIEVTRDYAGESSAGTSDVRMIPSATEPKLT